MKIGNLEVYGVIYKITNLINGKVYIGQTIQKRGFDGRYYCIGNGVEKVYKYHLKLKKNNMNFNEHLLNSIKKYGFDKFNITKIFDVAFSKEELNIKEYLWINYYNSTSNNYGYNNKDGGANGKYTKKSKSKMSIAKKGKYTGKYNHEAKPVICLTTNKLFETISEACLYYKIKKVTNIADCCKGKLKSAGKIKETKEKLVWMFYEDYLVMTSKEIKAKIDIANKGLKGSNNPSSRKVICLTTIKIFNCIKDAGKYYNIKSVNNISNCCRNKKTYCGKSQNGEKLQWKYISDLTIEEYIKYDIENKLKELELSDKDSSFFNEINYKGDDINVRNSTTNY